MKILFIGDYSNLHATLAKELRRMGHQADILSDGCGYMNVHADFFLKRESGIKGGFKYLFDLFNILPKLKGYDAVQLINTNFLKLKPQKIKYFYDRLKEQNGGMFLTLAGDEYFYVKACYDAKIFRFSEFKIGNELTEGAKLQPQHMYGWMSHKNKILAEYLYEDITGAMSVLPEYDMFSRPLLGDKVKFTNLPVDFSQLPQAKSPGNGKIRILTGMRSGVEHWKGTKILNNLAKEIEKEFPDKVMAEVAQDLSLQEFLQRISVSDIILDQLYAYSPAMTALYAMSMGKVAATGAQPEYYEYIGNPEARPLFALSPTDSDIKERLIELIYDKDKIKLLGEQSRELALANNDSKIVAQKFLDHWENLL